MSDNFKVHEITAGDRAPYGKNQTLGKPSLPKRLSAAKIHDGMTDQQVGGMGMKHVIKGALDASSANPCDLLTPTQEGKRLDKPAIHSGMNDQQVAGATLTHGPAIMAEAYAASGCDHPANMKKGDGTHGFNGQRRLPQSVKEN